MTELEQLEEKKISSKQVYDGYLLKVYHDEVDLPNKKKGHRELIRHNGAVCIVPLSDDLQVYVERQFRYPINSVITEIPAGKLDSKEEDHLEAAKRELREETGLLASKWTSLGSYIPTCAYSDEVIYMYLAQGLTQGQRDLDEDEFLNVKKVPLTELINLVMSGEIKDGKTQTAILKTYYYLQENLKK